MSDDYLKVIVYFLVTGHFFFICLCVSQQRLYHKDYHHNKTKTHIPPDIISNQVAKRCQDMLSDVIYRTYLHQWTCHPDQEDAIRARKTNEILSDVGSSSVDVYKRLLQC